MPSKLERIALANMKQRKSRIAQAEKMYSELTAVANKLGLFSANEGAKVDALLDEVVDIDAKWKAWSKIECVKRYDMPK